MLRVRILLQDIGVVVPALMEMYCDNQTVSLLLTILFSMSTPNISRLIEWFIDEETNFHTPCLLEWSAGWHPNYIVSSCCLPTDVFQARHVWSVCSRLRGSVSGYFIIGLLFPYYLKDIIVIVSYQENINMLRWKGLNN